MNDEELNLFSGTTDEERRNQLREQLWLLTAVRDDVQSQLRLLRTQVTDPPGYRWQSAAERGYVERVAELGSALDRAGRELDAACDAVREGLVRLNPGG